MRASQDNNPLAINTPFGADAVIIVRTATNYMAIEAGGIKIKRGRVTIN